MYLKNLQLINFKNYEDAEVELCPNVNSFVGRNGSGKTNILDAVYYLSLCKSYLNVMDRQNIRFNQAFFAIQGNWEKDGQTVHIHCGVKSGSKKVFKRNRKEYEKLSEHIGQFPVVMISPYDRDLISEGSDLRRKWIDGILSQFDRRYLEMVQRYSKVLEQRNALLKNMHEHRLFDRESIDVWDEQLSALGTEIYARRKSFIDEFVAVFQDRYNYIGEASEDVGLEYRSQLNESDFGTLLRENERRDLFTQYTNAGIHKDDLLFTIKGHPVKKFGSQGQQKSFMIALRLAQYEWLKRHLQTTPVLLLDDIFDKLDQARVQKLLQLVSNHYFGQVIVTDTDEERMRLIFDSTGIENKLFRVEEGRVNELKPLQYENGRNKKNIK